MFSHCTVVQLHQHPQPWGGRGVSAPHFSPHSPLSPTPFLTPQPPPKSPSPHPPPQSLPQPPRPLNSPQPHTFPIPPYSPQPPKIAPSPLNSPFSPIPAPQITSIALQPPFPIPPHPPFPPPYPLTQRSHFLPGSLLHGTLPPRPPFAPPPPPPAPPTPLCRLQDPPQFLLTAQLRGPILQGGVCSAAVGEGAQQQPARQRCHVVQVIADL